MLSIKEILMLGGLLLVLEIAFGYMLHITIPEIQGNTTYENVAFMLCFGLGYFASMGTLLMFNKHFK